MRFALICATAFLFWTAAAAQTPPQPAPMPTAQSAVIPAPVRPADPLAIISHARADFDAAHVDLDKQSLSDADVQARIQEIPPIQTEVDAAIAKLAAEQRALKARDAQLTAEARRHGEDAARAEAERRADAANLAKVRAEIKQARQLASAVDRADAALADRLKDNFSQRLWSQTRSILDPALWRDLISAAPDDMARVGRAIEEEADQAEPLTRNLAEGAIALLTALAAIALFGPVRVALNRLGYRRAARVAAPGHLHQGLLALWLVAVAVGLVTLAGGLVRNVLGELDVLSPDADKVLVLVTGVGAFAALIESLGRALLSPGRPQWRLAPFSEAIVGRLKPYPGLVAAAVALSALMIGLGSQFGFRLPTRIAGDCIAMLVQIAVTGGALMAVGRARLEQRAQRSTVHHGSRLPWVLATLAAWGAIAVAFVALLVGYLALATFLLRETVQIGVILALLALLQRVADEVFPELLSPKTRVGAALETALGVSAGALEPFGVLASGVARLALLLVAWAAVLAPVGATVEEIARRVSATSFSIRVGQVSISPTGVLGGLAVFSGGLIITRAIRRWLEARYLPKTSWDVGVRTSLAAAVTYIGALIALLVAFAYLGLSFAQMALLASALSVGIGFGLQAIIGNFVSGLILLAERPIRVGDWIALGESEGDVRKINMRATEIEMVDRSRLIVPNSELISKSVRNVTHSAAVGRVKIVLRVMAVAEPAEVREVLLACLKEDSRVLAEPPCEVYLTDVRDGALEFTAIGFLPSPRMAYKVKSDLYFKIVPRLHAAGFALASAGTVVQVNLPEIEAT